MPEILLPDGTMATVVLRRSARARRFSLRVSRRDGTISLTLPTYAREGEALDFARAQTAWLARVLAGMVRPALLAHGDLLPFEGRDLPLVAAPVRAARVEGDRMLVPEDPARLGRVLETFLKFAARQRLQAMTEVYAAQIGRSFSKITLRDTASRWGSCSHTGALSYNWRLIMAPAAVLDYVAAHEVAHLAQMNHSPAFWAVVEQLRPSYARERAWLKREGGRLHAIRFRE